MSLLQNFRSGTTRSTTPLSPPSRQDESVEVNLTPPVYETPTPQTDAYTSWLAGREARATVGRHH